MKKSLEMIGAMVVGGFAIHGALVACGGNGTAKAQSAGTTTACSQWAVWNSTGELGVFGEGPPVSSTASVATDLVPAGWEPFSINPGGNVAFRKCVVP